MAGFQVSLHWQIAAFELLASLKQVRQITRKWPFTISKNIPHMCLPSAPESQISTPFALRPTDVELQTIMSQVHRMTPNCLLKHQGQWYSINVLLVPLSITFHSIWFYPQQFSSYRQFWEKCTECPRCATAMSKVAHICGPSVPGFHVWNDSTAIWIRTWFWNVHPHRVPAEGKRKKIFQFKFVFCEDYWNSE